MTDKVYTCKVCGNYTDNRPFTATERMLGLNDKFEYFECAGCLCIQISEIPQNMDRYYPVSYYSYREPVFPTRLTGIRYFLKHSLAKYYMGKISPVGFILSLFYENPFSWLKPRVINFNSKILDVGCGTGRLLLSMNRSGYKNLTGIDPYNKEDIFYGNGVRVFKRSVFEVNEQYDLVMLHHSFEHMENPLEILEQLGRLITPQGVIIIQIPVGNSFAWRKYQTYWVQLDAPRHFFLHTVGSMNIMAKKCGLELSNVKHVSTAFQFTGSEKYLRGIGFADNQGIFSAQQFRHFTREAKRLNQISDGDAVCFYLKKV